MPPARSVVVAAIGFMGAPAILWVVVTQPFASSMNSTARVTASAEQLKQHVRVLSEALPPRFDAIDGLEPSAAYIQEQFAKAGRVTETTFTVRGKPYRNVSVFFGRETNERIIVGAHYDSFDGLPGADDNASGVSALIELANLLSRVNLKRSVELIAYALEEPPYFRTENMGSAFHAKSLRDNNKDVVLMISLEMIGYFTDLPNSQKYPLGFLRLIYPDTGNFIAVVGNLGGIGAVRRVKAAMKGAIKLPVHSINAPSFLPGIDFSDHLNFWRYGYPAVMVTDTAFYRNPAYHTEQDTWARLDYTRMAQVVEGIFAVVLNLAGTEDGKR